MRMVDPKQGGHDLFWRALWAFITLPGVVGVLIPAVIVPLDPWRGHVQLIGVLPLAVGAAILFSCVRNFLLIGKGTLAPWDPPKHLVVVGPHRFTRNPMYIGLLLSIAGLSWTAASPLLAAYVVAMGLVFHWRVVFYEEPWCKKQFGKEWVAYSQKVPRWLLRRNIRKIRVEDFSRRM